MKLRTNRAALAEAVRIAAAATGTAPPVLYGARIDVAGKSAVITCTNLDLTIRATVVAADDSADGSAIVPASLLGAFLKAADGEMATVTFDEGDALVGVEAGDSRLNLPPLALNEWPKLAAAKGKAVELGPVHLADLARIVGYASTDKTLPILSGVHFAGEVAEATDRYRFARLELGVDTGADVIIPAAPLVAVLRGAGNRAVTLRIDARSATFSAGELEWTTALVDGEYPNTAHLVRESSGHRLELPTERLLDAVKRVSLAVDGDDRHAMFLTVEGGKTTIRNRSTERGEIVDLVPSSGTLPEVVCIHGRHLRDLLDNVDDDVVVLEVETNRKAVEVRTDRLLQLVMPIFDKPAGA